MYLEIGNERNFNEETAVIHLLFASIGVVWCLIVAWLEVEIEGKDGWAKNAPTWKYKLDGQGKLWYKPFGVEEYREPTCSLYMQKMLTWLVKYKAGGREFTGYHCAVDTFQLFVAHTVIYMLFFQSAPWWVLEMRVFAALFMFWTLEDTLWFRLNPFYKDGKLDPAWHADWNRRWRVSKGMGMLFIQGCVIYALSFAIMPIIHLVW